jgi:hypothetical protein
MNRLGAGDG